jgi:hypothetical protein
MDDLEHVTFFGPNAAVLGARHNLTIALDRHRTIREPEVRHDTGQRQASGNFADFAVNGEAHSSYGGARHEGCQ